MRIKTLLFGVATLWGCSRHTSLEVQARLMPEGYIRYNGPLAGPYNTTASGAGMRRERATEG